MAGFHHSPIQLNIFDAQVHDLSTSATSLLQDRNRNQDYPNRELKYRIDDGVPFRWFTRFYSDSVPHHTTLQKAIKEIKPHYSDDWEDRQ
jgi:Transposase domain (DUF772)